MDLHRSPSLTLSAVHRERRHSRAAEIGHLAADIELPISDDSRVGHPVTVDALPRRESHVYRLDEHLSGVEAGFEEAEAEELEDLAPISSLETFPAHLETSERPKSPEKDHLGDGVERTLRKIVVDIPQPAPAVHLVLVPASILGYLLRDALTLQEPFSTAPFPSTFYPNFIGCLIMGFFQAGRETFWRLGRPASGEGWLWWFAVATGLCGSLTTFSSFMVVTFNSFSGSNGLQNLSGGQRFLNGLSVIGYGLCIFLAGILFGGQLWSAAEYLVGKFRRRKPAKLVAKVDENGDIDRETEAGAKLFSFELRPLGWSAFKMPSSLSDFLLVFLLLASIAAIIGPLAADSSGTLSKARSYGFGMLFAPFGTLVRYKFSRWNVPTTPRFFPISKLPVYFPAGTLLANWLGTALMCTLFVLARTIPVHSEKGAFGISDTYQCAIISAAMDGFCGCLTTISTLCFELVAMSRVEGGSARAWKYGLTSAIGGQLICVIIIGSAFWARGWGGDDLYCAQ